MILSTHFIASAAVANYTDSPFLIIALPLVLHFLLDMIPHWEYVEVATELKSKIPQIAIDILAGPVIILLAILLKYGLDIKLILWLFLGGVIGVIPDGLSLLHIIFPKNKVLKQFYAFHMAIHNKKMLGWKIGFTFQVLIDVLAILLIILPKA